MRTLAAAYARLGKFETGFPGSKRVPQLIADASLTLAASTSRTLDPQVYANTTKHTLFIEQFLLYLENATSLFSGFQFRATPTNGPNWMHSDYVPAWVLFDNDGTFNTSGRTMMWPLPEPYPLPPGGSLEISVRTGLGSTVFQVGMLGYTESVPRYTSPRKVPFALASTLGSALGNGTSQRFSDSDLAAGVPWVAEGLRVRGWTGSAEATAGNLLVRFGIKGRHRSAEARVPVQALADPYSLAIPLGGAAIAAKEGFSVEVENVAAGSLSQVDCAIVGYRMV